MTGRDKELQESVDHMVAIALKRHRSKSVDYYNALLLIAKDDITPNAIRRIAERALNDSE